MVFRQSKAAAKSAESSCLDADTKFLDVMKDEKSFANFRLISFQ